VTWRLLFLLLVLSPTSLGADQGVAPDVDGDLSIQQFVHEVESAIASNDATRWLALLSPNADAQSGETFFTEMIPPGVTRAVVRERDRLPLNGALPGEGFQLLVDVFAEIGRRGRIHTWRLDIRRPRESTERQPWRIIVQERLSTVDGLHRLVLEPDQQFAVKDIVVRSVDFELRLPAGDAFVADTDQGVTGVVLLGDGTMSFAPGPVEERGQVRLFAGSDTLDTSFSAVFLRMNPSDFDRSLKPQLTVPVAVDQRALRRAQLVFDEDVGKSFSLDLRDLSRENWSLLPQPGDFVAEIRTRRFNTLTYARSLTQPEDVTLFHRARQRNIASYASEAKLATRGRFFNEDDLAEFDVLDYQLDVSYAPDRYWLEGQARVRIRIRSFALAALTLRLADELNVTSITSDKLGRLMFLRVRNQNDVVINLPAAVPRDFVTTLTVHYSGRMQTQRLDQESVDVAGQPSRGDQVRADELPFVPAEPNWLFSNRSHWYPQNQITDYATATVRFTVPADYKVIASGVEAPDSPLVTAVTPTGAPARLTYVYVAHDPVRYIGAVISRFTRVDRAAVALEISDPRNTVTLAVDANRRQLDRGRNVVGTAAEIFRFYASLIDSAPYEAFTIAMVEHERPGGHSPSYFAVLNNPLPITPWTPRQDPAAFNNFPEFYIAHEIAHQWWGQGVGWKNYHEQWLSEGLAQYFAALYARERRGEGAFRDVLRHLRRWAMAESDQGPVYLGYRLGHIRGDSRVFRAIVYNKGASVLHMLRRIIGDDAFFRGLRRYYNENRFDKAGTEDLQRAMEAEAGRPLERFFEGWIYAAGLPRVRYSTTVEGQDLVVRFEQSGEVYDVPVTVAIQHGDRITERVVVLSEAVVEERLPFEGAFRGVEVNPDHAALGHFERR
jgi:hypothetical protein